MVADIDPERGLRYKGTTPCMVDFYADWCGPCQMLSPVIEQLEQESGIKVIKINVDELPSLARQFRVMSIPTLLFIQNGEVKKREMGYMPLEQLKAFVSSK